MTASDLAEARASSATLAEIRSQPDIWRRLLPDLDKRLAPLALALRRSESVLFLGCGSSHIGGQLGAHLLRSRAAKSATAEIASEYIYFGETLQRDVAHTVAIAVSRSGETSETVEAVERFRLNGGRFVAAVTCRPDSTLGRMVDAAVVFPEADERSVAQTRSVSTFLMALIWLADLVTERSAVHELSAIISSVEANLLEWQQLGAELVRERSWVRLVLLGSGAQYWIAREGALKAAEMSRRDADTHHFLEFRHGPKATLRHDALVIGLTHPDRVEEESQALRELQPLAGRVLRLRDWLGADRQPIDGPGLLIDLAALQIIAVELALQDGQNPDAPPTLTSHVTLDRLRP